MEKLFFLCSDGSYLVAWRCSVKYTGKRQPQNFMRGLTMKNNLAVGNDTYSLQREKFLVYCISYRLLTYLFCWFWLHFFVTLIDLEAIWGPIFKTPKHGIPLPVMASINLCHARCFSCKFYKMSLNSYFMKHLRATASK